MDRNSVKIIPLGGLGEIGKNIMVVEYLDDIIVIDCGAAFPDSDMYGVDLIIPNIDYLLKNKDKIKGIFLTHGHEDHIGALPYILKQINIPVYGTELTLAIVENKLREHHMDHDCELVKVEAGDIIKAGQILVEFIRSTHSIADSCCLALHTPEGIIFHTGDFKVDYTPIDGRLMDLERISELGKKGVLLLMADSTNVERKGHTISEKSIGNTLNRIISNAKGRVLVATFASNIHRVQQIIDASIKYGRKIAFSGRSMESISQVAIQLGYIKVADEDIINLDDIYNYPSSKVTIITTGSQGEPMAALARIAYGTHRKIRIEPNDLFIISSSPIPGNDKLISKVINELFRKGADVIYEDLEAVHVSGHAFREELKLIHHLIKPKYFAPVHGEYRHLKHHSDLAVDLGMDRSNVFIVDSGDVLEVNKDEAKISDKINTGVVFVDGLGVGDVGNIVLRDRRHLATDGMLTVVVGIERETYSIISGPDVITRGFVYAKEAGQLIEEIKRIAEKEVNACLDNRIIEWYVLKTNMKKSIERFIYEQTKRRPTIIPIIVDI